MGNKKTNVNSLPIVVFENDTLFIQCDKPVISGKLILAKIYPKTVADDYATWWEYNQEWKQVGNMLESKISEATSEGEKSAYQTELQKHFQKYQKSPALTGALPIRVRTLRSGIGKMEVEPSDDKQIKLLKSLGY